jgi:cytochrome P450
VTPELRPPGPAPRRGLFEAVRYFYRFATDPIGFVADRFERYGDIYYAPSGDVGLFVIKRPEHIREVLVTRAASYRKEHTAFDRLEAVLGNGLLNSDGDVWKRHRRLIQPSFSSARLAEYAVAMESEAHAWGERWQTGDRIDASREMMELTLRIVCRTLFSHDASADADAVRRAMTTLTDSITQVDVLPGWLPSPARRRLERGVAELDRIIYGMIERRRSGQDPARPDLLQALIAAAEDGDALTEREVRDQLITMFLAGHETTSHALTWTWMLLARHRDVRARLHDEIGRVVGEGRVSYADLERLVYTEQVLSEAMRLYPPAFMLARRASEDTQIGEYPVPAGSEVVIWTYMTHRDPRWYPEPEAFRPERFSADARARLPKQAYLPFGAGSRACIGSKFAMIEAQLALATLARGHRLDLVDENTAIGVKPRVTLAPKSEVEMLVMKRVD